MPFRAVYLSLLLGLMQMGSAPASESAEIAELISRAEGTYPASQLTLMCIAAHQNAASPGQTLALLQKAGAHCVRSDNAWDLIERVGFAGSYDWSGSDEFWSVLCKAKINPIMIATYNNPLYAPARFRPIAGGVNITAYKNFTVAMADHYISICPNMVEELFNEPSALNWTTVPWSGTSYAAMLAPVSAAIKAAQPRVAVYSGGIGFDPGPEETDWIKQMVGAGKKFPAVDAYAFHPYNYDQKNPAATLPPEQLLIDAKTFAEASASTGQGKPVALTEYGFPLQALGGDLTKQAFYAARGMLAAIIGQYPVQTYYDLIDDGSGTDLENSMGLFRNGGAKPPYEMKPTGAAFAAITAAMAGATAYTIAFDPEISAPTVSFDRPEGKIFVIWTYDANGAKSYMREIGPFRQLGCKDVLGKSFACHYSNGTLSMALSERSGPIIVTALK
jgi:hypothetical protein